MLKIKHVIARGKILMEDEEVVKFGVFEPNVGGGSSRKIN